MCSIKFSTWKIFSAVWFKTSKIILIQMCQKKGGVGMLLQQMCVPDQAMTGHSCFYRVLLWNNNLFQNGIKESTFINILLFQYIVVLVICNIISQGRSIRSHDTGVCMNTVRTTACYMVFILTYLVYFAFYGLLGQNVIWELLWNSLIQ